MPKRKSSPDDPSSFEDSLAELEAIVEAMEHESLPLEKLVESYEQGSRLLARCEAILQTARQRLETISLQTPPASDPAEDHRDPDDSARHTSGPESEDDDIRLF